MPAFEREETFRGTIKELPRIIGFIEECCATSGVDEDLQFDVVLAVEEACSNVFEHAYSGKPGALSVNFCTERSDLVITLRDEGRGFDPRSVPKPDMNVPLERRPVGGLGMHLMYTLMDEVRYTFAAEGNVLLLVKRGAIHGAPGLHRESPAEGAPAEGAPAEGISPEDRDG